MKRARSSRAARWVAGVIALVGFAGPGSAAAAYGNEGRFVLDTTGCPKVSEVAIRRIVGIEIGDMLIEPGVVVDSADRLMVRCDGDVAEVEAVASSGAARVARTLALRDFPGDAAPRALALAGLEVLAAQSPAVRERIEARHAPPTAPPAPPPHLVAEGAPRNRMGLSIVRRTFPTTNGISTWGARFDLDREIGARWDVALDVEVDGTQRTIPLGEASALLASVGGFAGVRVGSPALFGVFGIGCRIGAAWLAGEPMGATGARGADVLRPWLGPALSARLRASGGRVGAAIFAEAGIAARGAQGLAQGDTVLAVSGVWVTVGAGIWF